MSKMKNLNKSVSGGEEMNIDCKHNNRVRYMNGFKCLDCNTFFDKDTKVYKLSEGLSDLWCVLHNYTCDNPDKRTKEIETIKKKIFDPKNPTIEMYNEALDLVHKLGLTKYDALVPLGKV